MFKKILVATDGSAYAKRAEEYAIKLAKDEDGEVTAITVGDISYIAVPIETDGSTIVQSAITEAIENEKKNAEKILNEFKQKAEEENMKVNTVAKIGKPTTEIIEESKKGYDVIVIGSRGLTGIKRFFLGSVAEHVVRHSKIPVLVVKEEEEEE